MFNRRTTGGRYWFSGGWSWPAVAAWVVGSLVGLLTIQTPLFSGPLSGIAAGVDISLVAGSVVAALVFLPFAARETARAV